MGGGQEAQEPRSRHGVAKACGLRARHYPWPRWPSPLPILLCALHCHQICQHELTHLVITIKCPRTPNGG